MGVELKLDISEIAQHESAAEALIQFAGDERLFLFDAPMGSGKTTFIKSLCRYLGVTNAISSPTYSIVNEYNIQAQLKVFHFDLYRLKNSEELFSIGFDDYLNSTNYLFIEWPELALPFLDSYVRIIINTEDNKRYLCAQKTE